MNAFASAIYLYEVTNDIFCVLKHSNDINIIYLPTINFKKSL